MGNGGYWRRQPRDSHGRWVSMGGGARRVLRKAVAGSSAVGFDAVALKSAGYGAAAGGVIGGAVGNRHVRRGVARSYIPGSFEKNFYTGEGRGKPYGSVPGATYKGAKIGAEFRLPRERQVLVKGIVGFSGPPDRKYNVTPSAPSPSGPWNLGVGPKEKPNPKSKARPNPQRKKKQSAGSTVTADPIQRTNDWIDDKAKDLAQSAVDKVPGATAAGRFVAAPVGDGGGSSLRAQSAGRKVRR